MTTTASTSNPLLRRGLARFSLGPKITLSQNVLIAPQGRASAVARAALAGIQGLKGHHSRSMLLDLSFLDDLRIKRLGAPRGGEHLSGLSQFCVWAWPSV